MTYYQKAIRLSSDKKDDDDVRKMKQKLASLETKKGSSSSDKELAKEPSKAAKGM